MKKIAISLAALVACTQDYEIAKGFEITTTFEEGCHKADVDWDQEMYSVSCKDDTSKKFVYDRIIGSYLHFENFQYSDYTDDGTIDSVVFFPDEGEPTEQSVSQVFQNIYTNTLERFSRAKVHELWLQEWK